MPESAYLGLDCSTQSLTGILTNRSGEVALCERVAYDQDLPEFGTVGGQLASTDPTIGHAPPSLWLAALDLLLARIAARDDCDLSRVRGVAVSGQQHGSVYLSREFGQALDQLDARGSLREQIEPALSRPVAPLWTDSSTTDECDEIRQLLGGAAAAADLTGSDIFERFTGAQIRRFAKTEPKAWEDTHSVALVSSFLTSVLAGQIAPIDHGDASGTNLMDIRSKSWSPEALEATWPDLANRLPPLANPCTVVGRTHSYFRRYGLGKQGACMVIVGSGDNPCSLIGVGAVRPGDITISLGTSDTLFGLMEGFRPEPTGQGHVFVAPTGGYMSLLCFRNGALARERVRDQFGLSWKQFEEQLLLTPPGNRGQLMLPWFEPEIVPRVAVPEVRRLGGLEPGNAAANCRAVVEGQVLAMRLHSEWMQVAPGRIRITGGASHNRSILQIAADVFGCPVVASEIADSAALGAALRALHAERLHRGREISWLQLAAQRCERGTVERLPRPEAIATYERLLPTYAAAERMALAAS